jgi:ubiquinone/menaquinone biosynthesis C-methylase UbiE
MKLKETFEHRAIHDGWEAVYRGNELQDRLNARMLERIFARLGSPPGALALDAGCGAGYHSLALARRGCRVIGIDISSHILDQAAASAARAGLDERVEFRCDSLEDLSFPDETFDLVHCRGVLMHIPDWTRALEQLCRVLKPGGKIVIFESNSTAVESVLVKLLRRLRSNRSRLVRVSGGLEFWAEQYGLPVVTRIADINCLMEELRYHGVEPLARLATEFWDIFRFQNRVSRSLAISFNRLWFGLRLPAALSMGNAVLGRKTLGYQIKADKAMICS